MDKTVPNWRYYGLKTGIRSGNASYTRFIILGRSRVGSNFLRGLLNSSSQITIFGEIFQNRDDISWGMSGYPRTKRMRSRFLYDPIRFLEQDVFIPFPASIRAVGFKIFYYHARQEEWKSIWEYLYNHKELKVIHIKRRNILKTHLSRKKAIATDEWVSSSKSQSDLRPLKLDYEECIQDFEKTRRWEVEFDGRFAAHDKMEIYYEELVADYQRVMDGVQDFLGIDRETLYPETQKQSQAPISNSISNYAELKEKFADTPWSGFFDE